MNIESFEDDDLFGRKNIAKELTKMIEETQKPFSIAIDSSWGSGKSVFQLKWKKLLEEDERKTIYIDAWKMDYYIDPIIPIVGTLIELLELENADFKDLKSALLVIMKDILKNITKIDYDEVLESFKNKSRTDNAEFISNEEQRELIRSKLTEYSSKYKKVYFFIDELDRCKPLFAINFLERIKHFLDIPNFVFVFSIDLKQLSYSIKHVYGNIDSDSYFRKFFDIVYNLPAPSSLKYFEYLLRKNEFITRENIEYIDRIKLFIGLNTQIGLRECEKIYEIIRMANHNIVKESGNEYIFPYLIITKAIAPNHYREFIRKEKDWVITNGLEWRLSEVYKNDYDYNHVLQLYEILGRVRIEDRRNAINNTEFRASDIQLSMADYAIKNIEYGVIF